MYVETNCVFVEIFLEEVWKKLKANQAEQSSNFHL